MNTLKIIKREDYIIVQINRGKVNAMNFEMINELSDIFTLLESDDEVKGIILTGQPHYFTAGLDLIELYEYDEEQIKAFFIALGSLYIQLMEVTKPFISAITGHCPAGGCVLAVTSDSRIMAEGDRYKIGLNEVAVNIQISQNLVEAYSFWVGTGLANRYILEGKLLSGEEALSAGLVDELVPLDQVLECAEKKMQHYMKADQEIFINTKRRIRKPLLDTLDVDTEASIKESIPLWWKPEIRIKMKAYVESFSNKKK